MPDASSLPTPSARRAFRALLDRPGRLLALPGVYDAIGARLAAQAGFEALYMTGAGVCASLGYPDYGLVTMSEMVDRAGVIAAAVPLPLLSDADTGYGNELNVTRTVREFEKRGVAAIHIEDQVAPKRCGHLDGKELVSRDDFVAKIRAAVRARVDPDFTIVARSDARAVTGLDDAIDRVNAALDVGADVAFVESPVDLDEVAAIPKRVHGPCLLNLVQGGKTPLLSFAEIAQLGYRLAIVPGATLAPTLVGCDRALADLARTGSIVTPASAGDVRAVFARFGASDWDALRDGAKVTS